MSDSYMLILTAAAKLAAGLFAALTSITVLRPEACWMIEQSPSLTFKKWTLGMRNGLVRKEACPATLRGTGRNTLARNGRKPVLPVEEAGEVAGREAAGSVEFQSALAGT